MKSIGYIEYDDKWQPAEERLIKLEKSIADAKDTPLKVLVCPICGKRIAEASADKSGIIKLKCSKCKGEYPFNLAYYRRQKQGGYYLKFKKPVHRAEG